MMVNILLILMMLCPAPRSDKQRVILPAGVNQLNRRKPNAINGCLLPGAAANPALPGDLPSGNLQQGMIFLMDSVSITPLPVQGSARTSQTTGGLEINGH